MLYLLDVLLHAIALSIIMHQIEHVEPHAVDARQNNKLVFVAHVRQLLLEAGNDLISSKFFCQLKDDEQL